MVGSCVLLPLRARVLRPTSATPVLFNKDQNLGFWGTASRRRSLAAAARKRVGERVVQGRKGTEFGAQPLSESCRQVSFSPLKVKDGAVCVFEATRLRGRELELEFRDASELRQVFSSAPVGFYTLRLWRVHVHFLQVGTDLGDCFRWCFLRGRLVGAAAAAAASVREGGLVHRKLCSPPALRVAVVSCR